VRLRGRAERTCSYNEAKFVVANNKLLLSNWKRRESETFVRQRRLSAISNRQAHSKWVVRGRDYYSILGYLKDNNAEVHSVDTGIS